MHTNNWCLSYSPSLQTTNQPKRRDISHAVQSNSRRVRRDEHPPIRPDCLLHPIRWTVSTDGRPHRSPTRRASCDVRKSPENEQLPVKGLKFQKVQSCTPITSGDILLRLCAHFLSTANGSDKQTDHTRYWLVISSPEDTIVSPCSTGVVSRRDCPTTNTIRWGQWPEKRCPPRGPRLSGSTGLQRNTLTVNQHRHNLPSLQFPSKSTYITPGGGGSYWSTEEVKKIMLINK